MGGNGKRLVIRGGTLIDGSGSDATPNETIVIDGDRITSVGVLPTGLNLEDRDTVEVIDASGKWVMPGMIDGHTHLSFGNPRMSTPPIASKGTASPEFTSMRAAKHAQAVLRSGVTSISIPGGTWFIDVAIREAINSGLLEGPRISCSGRFIVTYDSIFGDDPTGLQVADHRVGVMANGVHAMVTEVRRQLKHGVNYIKLGDSLWGDIQTISPEEMRAVADEAHRRNAKVTIHSRGSGSTRAAAEAGLDWILHADLATEADLDAVAQAGTPIMPTLASQFYVVDQSRDVGMAGSTVDVVKRNLDSSLRGLERLRALGIKILCGTDSGNSIVPHYGIHHAREAEILVKHGGFSPAQAIKAITKDNAITMVGMEDQLGEITPGKLADVLILKDDPLADISVLQNWRSNSLETMVKDGRVVDLDALADLGDQGLR